MGYQQVGQLIDKWLNDPEFRKQFRDNPEGTVKKNGVQLSQEEWAALMKVDWKLPDNELKTQISKGM